MKPSNVSLLKLSRVSSRFLLRKSVKAERRWFVTILNPSAPKIKRLQRNPGLETQTPSVEPEKISLLNEALGELNLEIESLVAHESSTEEVESSTKNVTPPTASEEEIYPGSVIENVEKILTDDLPTSPVAPNTSQKEADENINIAQVGIEEAKKSAAKTTTAQKADSKDEDDSSSSDSDRSSSSSSSSESEDEEKKPMERTRLDQVYLDSYPTLIQC